jgi:hypothetical protein
MDYMVRKPLKCLCASVVIEAGKVFANAAVRAVLQLIYLDRSPVILARLSKDKTKEKRI